MPVGNLNPFARRESYPVQAVWTYKLLSIISWLVVVVTSVNYSFLGPEDDKEEGRHTIWEVNRLYFTPFALNATILAIYWIALFILQVGYVWQLFSTNANNVTAAAGVGSHFIINNLLQFAFVMLLVRSHFVWAEFILIVNFFNLSSLYFRHNTHPRLIHIPAVSGPLAWTFVALFWNGAIAVNASSVPARIAGNVAIWAFLVYGLFFLVAFKDYTVNVALSILCASIGVRQFLAHVVSLQWIFAFTIMAVLFLSSLVVLIPGLFGKEIGFGREGPAVPADQERAPLLDDH